MAALDSIGKSGVVKMKRRVKKAVDRARKLSRRFYGYRPRHLRSCNIVWPKALVSLGFCAQIDYVTDKDDGKVRRYYHEFARGIRVFAGADSQPNGESLIVIKGKFKITEDGLVG